MFLFVLFCYKFSCADLVCALRRTGITLKEGEIDDDGMENLEGMFSSSPEPAVQNHGNATVITSEDMEIGGSKHRILCAFSMTAVY